MKANEFIKKYGIDEARKFLEVPSYSINQLMMLKSGVDVREIERLVESHNLVSKVGGLKRAKLRATNKFKPVGKNLLKAIADVESCQ